MRVAHILRKYDPAEWGGTETALLRLTEGLRRHGTESVVFGPRTEFEPLTDPLSTGGARVRRFGASVPVWGLSRELRRRMQRMGGNLWSFDLLPALLREPGLDVMHTHALGRLGGIAMTAAAWRRIPFVVSIHGGALDMSAGLRQSLERPDVRGFEWGRLFGALVGARKLFDRADAILACNDTEARLLRERHPRCRVLVQPHGIPLALFRRDHRATALEAFPELRGRSVLLAPGRIDVVKNQPWLVERMRSLIERHPAALLVFAGPATDSACLAALQRRIDDLGLRSHVLLTGGLPAGDPKLIGLFQLARAVVLASVSETFGLVILEAWAAGTPVIASRTSGACSLIRDGINGWLFDLACPEEFQEAVGWTLEHPNSAALIAEAAAKRVAEYDGDAVASRLNQLYHDLASQRHRTRGWLPLIHWARARH
jgi:alpha-maltose-1-phosphate synthase